MAVRPEAASFCTNVPMLFFTGRAALILSRDPEPVAVAERIQRELELVRNQH